ncbi:cyclic nucleotide-binding domain-containing protein [Desulfopila aestuarii]|uniref:PilZ domain-containing protein n=1 Tax=Desulfopila aestuarii DSM 18488 TaxID=1121416 RepID=A0A1M7Y2E6_9BACT|nr:cyclic nucleotide-binding domain-containing protein [Desulfopila aestuarii]SHO45870.1 PilZ domain-containing protein [Desulfopila aestuarii DSM 18488]
MDIERDLQSEAQQKVQALLKSAEEMRRQKRVAHGVTELTNGRLELLFNDELAAAIPEYLSDDGDEDAIDTAQHLLKCLGDASISPDPAMRLRAVMILSLSVDRVVATENVESICVLSEILNAWLEQETEFVPGYEVLCRQVQDICAVTLREGRPREAERVLMTLHGINTGKLKRKKSMRSVAARTIEKIAFPELLTILFEQLFTLQGEKSRRMENILRLLGKPAISKALELLEPEDEGEKRQQLMHFLTSAGRMTLRVFEEVMEQNTRWNVRCDMLQILIAMHDDGIYPLVELNLVHPDIRVQREAVECVFKLGGENMVQRLTEALFQVDDTLKNVIVKKLAKLDSLAIRDALLTLLDEKVSRRDFSDDLLLSSIVVALQPYPDTRALIQLREFKDYLNNGVGSRKLLHLVDDALLMMESEMRHRRHRKIETEQVGFADDPEAIRQAKRKIQEIEKDVIRLLEKGEGKQAAEQLFLHCVEAAREKDFVTAERLRDRILGADTGAVELVIEADEVINWERNSKIPATFFELWKPLRSAIGAREFEALYAVLVPEQYQDDEIIAREGERDDRLYFINAGSVSLVCSTGPAKTFLKRLQPGSVLGAEQFFSISVWTVTARARTPVELHSMRRRDLQELENQYRGISESLQKFCQGSNSVPDLLKMSGGDRRGAARYPVAAIIRTALIDAYGAAGHRSFVGQLQDISQGGFCYSIGIANKENARLLLGRQVRFELALDGDTILTIEGMVVGMDAAGDKKDMFRVHVRMLEQLSQAEVRQIVDMIG